MSISYWDLLPREIKRIIVCDAFVKEGLCGWKTSISLVNEELKKKTFCVFYSLDLCYITCIFRSNNRWHIQYDDDNVPPICIECHSL